jgi:hypothetical protein
VNPFEPESSDLAPVTEYRGLPNETQVAGEKGRWRRFLEALLPWLSHKWGLAERLADARVRKEMAEAHILEAKAAQEALKTIDMAKRMEAEKLNNIDAIVSEAESPTEYAERLRHEMEQIQEKLDTINFRHGTRIELYQSPAAPVATTEAGSDSIEDDD